MYDWGHRNYVQKAGDTLDLSFLSERKLGANGSLLLTLPKM
jgi:hypothetical protein